MAPPSKNKPDRPPPWLTDTYPLSYRGIGAAPGGGCHRGRASRHVTTHQRAVGAKPPVGRPCLWVDWPRARSPEDPPAFLQVGILVAFTPRRTLGKSPTRATMPKRPTTGQLALKGKSLEGTSKAPIAVSSNTMGSSAFTPSYTLASPLLRKIMSAGPGMGKKLVPSLDTKEQRALRESNDSTSGSVRCRLSPPPIRGPPGQFEGEQEKSDVEKLLHVTSVLRKKNTALMDTVSELKMAYRDLEDEFNHLRISNNLKIKRIAKAINREDLLEIPSP